MRARPLHPLILLLAAALLLASCRDDDEEVAEGLPSGCEPVEEPSPQEVSLQRPRKLEPPGDATAVVETSCGGFEIELDAATSPKTTASFAYLVDQGVYDGTSFHRIVPDFVIQGGDPLGDGTGGPGYFVDEPPPPQTEYTEGTVAMAKTAAEPPGRSGSQFFVVAAADAGLPADFAVLGEVSEGFETVERIERLGDPGAGEEGTPEAPVLIERVTLRGG
jgi:peptidyl-prolyl cis-trans isomerase B (cyclophilin B)